MHWPHKSKKYNQETVLKTNLKNWICLFENLKESIKEEKRKDVFALITFSHRPHSCGLINLRKYKKIFKVKLDKLNLNFQLTKKSADFFCIDNLRPSSPLLRPHKSEKCSKLSNRPPLFTATTSSTGNYQPYKSSG